MPSSQVHEMELSSHKLLDAKPRISAYLWRVWETILMLVLVLCDARNI